MMYAANATRLLALNGNLEAATAISELQRLSQEMTLDMQPEEDEEYAMESWLLQCAVLILQPSDTGYSIVTSGP